MNRRTFLALAAFGAVAACTSSDAVVEPVWGKEPCAHCAMVLSDKRFGAQLVTSDGDRFTFDDVGCMVLFFEERNVVAKRAWVRDGEAGRWVDAAHARYVAGAKSPMDFGYEARAATDGSGVACSDMRQTVLAKRRNR